MTEMLQAHIRELCLCLLFKMLVWPTRRFQTKMCRAAMRTNYNYKISSINRKTRQNHFSVPACIVIHLFRCSGSADGLPFLPGASPPVGPPCCGPSGLSQHLRKHVWRTAGPSHSEGPRHVLCHSDSSDVTRGGSDW